MLPNFFVAGVQKAATTSLHEYLKVHPDIYLPEQKETKFFADDSRYEKGIDHYRQKHFSAWAGQSAVGEIDPDYIFFEQALERMVKDLDLSQTKFIFIFRNPVERAFSHYLMTFRRGYEPLSFEDAIAAEGERIEKNYFSRLHFSYTTRGFYHRQLSRFAKHLHPSQMLFLLTEDLHPDPLPVLRRICEFLGINGEFSSHNTQRRFHTGTRPRNVKLLRRIVSDNPGFEKKIARILIPWERPRHWLRSEILRWNETSIKKTVLSAATRQMLSARYRTENQRLGEFIGRDLRHWDEAPPRGAQP